MTDWRTGGLCPDSGMHSFRLIDKGLINQNVFLAKQVERNNEASRLVAIKRIQLDRLNNNQFEQQIKEVQLGSLMRHPNLMPIVSSFITDSELWIVMPIAEYLSCKHLAAPYGLGETAIAYIARDVLKALRYLHERGIIHLGIRSSRVLVDSQGQCRLSGFKYSLSMVRNTRLQTTLYQYPSNAVCNLKWLAPEVLEQNLYGYNEKSDVYSLGILCCEIANGCTPFKGMPPSQILIDKLTGNIPRPMDSTCEQLDKIISVLPQTQKERANFYKSRKFSHWFHHFTNELCLNIDVKTRPTARDLLKHKFFVQVATCKSLIPLLPNKKPIDETYDVTASASETNSDLDDKSICETDTTICDCNSSLEPFPLSGEQVEWSF